MTSWPILEISTIVGCSCRCDYCPQKEHVRSYAETSQGMKRLGLSTFEACLKTVPTTVEIMFAGMAEPWLNPEATAMALHAHQKGHVISAYTTAVGFTQDDADRLREVPFRQFCLHLPDAAGRMKLQVNDRYLAGLRAALTLPHDCMVIGELHPGVRQILGHDVTDGSAALISRAGLVPGVASSQHVGRIRCSATDPGTLNHNVLLPDGAVVICCCDYSITHTFGNLLQASYASLFEGGEFARVMRGLGGDETENIICRRCELAIPA